MKEDAKVKNAEKRKNDFVEKMRKQKEQKVGQKVDPTGSYSVGGSTGSGVKRPGGDIEEREVEAKEEEEREVEEMTFGGRNVYVTNKVNGLIYEFLPEDEIGDEIGKIKKGKPFFY